MRKNSIILFIDKYCIIFPPQKISDMQISGFTFSKNATKLYYPVKESIESILPVVDEFIIVLGDGDEDDRTEELISSIGSDKIKIIHTKWDLKKYPNGTEYAHQTDIAREACTGDWCFYLQTDEAVHEKYLPLIKESCQKYLDDARVEGFLFHYKHFWGDYNHFVLSHPWYAKEIRIIRNNPDIHSWRDAQSFRVIPDFDGLDYHKKENTRKLNVIELDAYIYHYGYVRPPELMQNKRKSHNTNYLGEQSTREAFKDEDVQFDYGDLNKTELFRGTHPKAMLDFIKRFDWQDQLHYGSTAPGYRPQKHDKLKYRILTFIEQNLLNGNQILNFKNYKIIK